MLAELRIKNLGIIEDVTWQLRDGLNIVTGETGAGKSLIIDAVEILLSGRTGEDAIRYGADEATVEGVFSLPQSGRPETQRTMFEESDTLVINCRLRRKAPSIIRINGQAATRLQLVQVGRSLVDIHGQSEHLSLLNEKTHLDILDAYGRCRNLRNEFSLKFAELRNLESELTSLEKSNKDRAREEDYLRFQLNEITHASLREGEEEELQQEHKLLSSAERLKELSDAIYRDLYEDDSQGEAPALDKLSDALRAMKKLAEMDPTLAGNLKYVEEVTAGITETARDIHAYNSRLQYDPERLAEIESRLETIRQLKRKYGPTITDVLTSAKKIKNNLESMAVNEERRSELLTNVERLKQGLGKIAQQLSEERGEAAKKLIVAVRTELNDLDMKQVEFSISLNRNSDTEGLPLPDGHSYACDETGIDAVEFMVSTNPGEPVKPLVKIASTGELSRFTLALKAALAGADGVPVLIFDEIDIGVGGRSGDIIGKKLWTLGRNHQVICVTHLPQITAFADAHYIVQKREADNRTTSFLKNIEGETRIRELAAMLGGTNYTETAVKNARELLAKAEDWKIKSKVKIKKSKTQSKD